MRTTAKLSLLALLVALALPARPAHALFIIVNTDSPGEGFNDPTPVAPVGGNPGVTVGQQRLNVFTKAGQIWDAILNSPIPIFVSSSFDPLPCSANSGVLGSAGPWDVESDFAGAPYPGTWFVVAEANRITNSDLQPGSPDISAQFQSNVGTAGCLSTRYWYYGYDGNEGANGIDLLPVLLHEFGHGLGFLTLTDETTGDYFSGLPSIFDRYLMDNVSHKHWIDMTPTERIASAINTTHLVWDGPSVNARAPLLLGYRAHVVTTGALAGDFPSGQGVFSAPLTTTGITGDVVLVNDGVGTVSDGCETPFVNAGAVAGKIALVDRSGTCSLAQQSLNAQNAGAIGVIIINNVAGPEPQLRGAAPAVSIPVTAVSQTDGNAIRTALGSGVVHATLALDPTGRAGLDAAGHVEMFAPNPDQPGSSVSHFDVSAFPNLLMEPSINPDLDSDVDLTSNMMRDIGWYATLSAPVTTPHEVALSVDPNPSRIGGTVRFQLPAAQSVDVAVYDVAGRAIAHLAHGTLGAGAQAVRWSRTDDRGNHVGPGVYLVRLRTAGVERTANLVLVD